MSLRHDLIKISTHMATPFNGNFPSPSYQTNCAYSQQPVQRYQQQLMLPTTTNQSQIYGLRQRTPAQAQQFQGCQQAQGRQMMMVPGYEAQQHQQSRLVAGPQPAAQNMQLVPSNFCPVTSQGSVCHKPNFEFPPSPFIPNVTQDPVVLCHVCQLRLRLKKLWEHLCFHFNFYPAVCHSHKSAFVSEEGLTVHMQSSEHQRQCMILGYCDPMRWNFVTAEFYKCWYNQEKPMTTPSPTPLPATTTQTCNLAQNQQSPILIKDSPKPQTPKLSETLDDSDYLSTPSPQQILENLGAERRKKRKCENPRKIPVEDREVHHPEKGDDGPTKEEKVVKKEETQEAEAFQENKLQNLAKKFGIL